jgi:hypothetical protein
VLLATERHQILGVAVLTAHAQMPSSSPFGVSNGAFQKNPPLRGKRVAVGV